MCANPISCIIFKKINVLHKETCCIIGYLLSVSRHFSFKAVYSINYRDDPLEQPQVNRPAQGHHDSQ